MDYYTFHGILQARIPEWVAVPFSSRSSNPGIEPRPPTLQVDILPAEPPGKPKVLIGCYVNRFKGLDLIECLTNYGWRFVTLYSRQGSRPSPWKRNAKKQMTGWVGLTNSCEKKRSEKQRRKGKI